jgi:uncharacterized integral membrane protein (TIGR00697 family)
VSVSVAILMMPLTFLITDVVAEVYGKKVTREFVVGAVIATIVILAFTYLFILLPSHSKYAFTDEYALIFSNSIRIMVASVISFSFAQLHDIWAYEFWKKKTNGKHLWLRNNASTIVS